MKSGTLKHTVQIEEYTEAQDSAGQPIKSWTLYATRRASMDAINPLTSPIVRADERFEPGLWRFGMRYVPGLTNLMRLIHAGTVFEILDAPDTGTRQMETVITCRTGINPNG